MNNNDEDEGYDERLEKFIARAVKCNWRVEAVGSFGVVLRRRKWESWGEVSVRFWVILIIILILTVIQVQAGVGILIFMMFRPGEVRHVTRAQIMSNAIFGL